MSIRSLVLARLGLALLCVLAALSGATGPASAQEGATVATEAANAAQEDPAATAADPSAQDTVIDYDTWDDVAARAERMVSLNVASEFALTRQRGALVIWRDLFAGHLDTDANRLQTLDAQLAALGPAPEHGSAEPEQVAARRAALIAQRDEVAAPGRLVAEAHARANGLIGEVDRLIRDRQTASLLVQGPSPLNPENWTVGLTAAWEGMRDLAVEGSLALRNDIAAGAAWRKLVLVLAYLGLSAFLLVRGRAWLAASAVRDRGVTGGTVKEFLRGLGQIAVPVLGLIALSLAIMTLDLPGLRSSAFAEAIPSAGAVIVAGWWLSQQHFPQRPKFGPLGYDENTCRRARRVAVTLAWALGLWLPVLALLDSGNVSSAARAVVNFPIVVILGILLFRLGQLLRRAPANDLPDKRRQQGRIRRIVGQFAKAAGVAGPLLAALGFAAAAEGLMLPMIISLAVLGLVIYLQFLVTEIYAIWARSKGREAETLVPVIISFGFLVTSLPVLALIWGARVADLQELWTRFREGFAVGDSRISPTDFLTFALVFAVGYLLTRLVQGALRNSVLPRTRLDLGGQNAIVAGFGYVGIMLAAIAAVTSAGIDLSNLAIVAGALSVGIGFGLQNIVSNFVSGIILLIERPVSEGDWIEVGGQMGYVRDISVRSTRIETFDRTDVIIPNADLVSGQVTNWTRGNLVGRVIVPVGVAYGTDVEKVTAILREIAEAHPLVLMQPPPNVFFTAFGASSLDFEIRAILRDVNFVVAARSEMNHSIAKRFAQEGIEIPFPQQDLWLRNPETLRRHAADKDDAHDQTSVS